mmetsp:Transcript_24261/g.43736  ORF Transcript_24261/g.43736 Transcript_24261/m.43736 type:complete len:93 (+) Transcript_24261:269-547(+)
MALICQFVPHTLPSERVRKTKESKLFVCGHFRGTKYHMVRKVFTSERARMKTTTQFSHHIATHLSSNAVPPCHKVALQHPEQEATHPPHRRR